MSEKEYTPDGYLEAGYIELEDLEKDEVKLFFYNHGEPEWTDVAQKFYNSFVKKYTNCPNKNCVSFWGDNKHLQLQKGPVKGCECYNPGDGFMSNKIEIRTEDEKWKTFLKEFKAKLASNEV